MDPFVDQLSRLAAAEPTRAKWVFVPSHAAGRTLGDRLVLGGRDWANLRFVTPLDVALRMGAPFLVERGIDPSEEGLGPALVMRLLLDLPEAGGYFRPLATQPPMAQALWSAVRELRLAGLGAADLERGIWESAEKQRELHALVVAYERFLDEHRRGDRATVFEEAMRHPDWCPLQPGDCWTELPETIWAPLERRLLEAMPGERIAPETLALPGVPVPRRLARAHVIRRDPGEAAPLATLMAAEAGSDRGQTGVRPGSDQGQTGVRPRSSRTFSASPRASRQLDLLAFAHPAPTPAGAALEFFAAGGADAEVEEAFRRILASGRPLDDVEIVCAADAYTTLVWEKALRYDWPATVAQGIPATLTRPGRALLALVKWVEDDFSAGLLRELLQSGDVAFGEAEGLTPARGARLLVKAQAAWGRETYGLSLARLARASRTRAERDDLPADQREGLRQRADQADRLAVWVASLLASVPRAGDDRRIALQTLVEGAERFVRENATQTSALDRAAAATLVAAITDLGALGGFRCGLDQGMRLLRERVETVRIAVDRPRPGHVHIAPLAAAGSSGRRLIFVVGLEEGRVFPAPFEDPVLLDVERARLADDPDDLPLAVDRTDEAVYTAVARLAAISARPDTRLLLSYSCRDLREFRQTYASWLLLQVFRTSRGRPSATYADLHDALGAPVSCVPAEGQPALGESRWWLGRLAAAGAAATPVLVRAYRAVGAGLAAEAARASAEFTEFDGHVPDAGPVLDPCAAGRVVSPTQLEEAAECPFRFFLRRGLGVDAIESGERDRDVWLDPLLRGSLLHDLYAELLRRCRAEGRRVVVPADADWLRDRGLRRLEALAREMPPPSGEIHDRESREFLDDLALFAAAEAALEPGRTPIAFEVSFGRADAVDDEPLAVAEPIAVDVGGGLAFRLAGRIDRIDQIGDATFEILDYKTGGYWEADWQGTFAGGRRLQHALYGLAALELLKRRTRHARVAGAQYYFSSAKGQQERKVIPAPAAATLRAVLGDIRDVVAAGAFVHAPDAAACRWCDYGHACGEAAAARAERKLGASALAPYRRLVRHE
jgi:ATP-dependent helicase/nuclease subunit B